MAEWAATFKAGFKESEPMKMSFTEDAPMRMRFEQTHFVHTDDFNELYNKPKINRITVEGEKTGADYNLQDKMSEVTAQEIDEIIYG